MKRRKIIIGAISSLMLVSAVASIGFACANETRDIKLINQFNNLLNEIKKDELASMLYQKAQTAYDQLYKNQTNVHLFNSQLKELIKETQAEYQLLKQKTQGSETVDTNQNDLVNHKDDQDPTAGTTDNENTDDQTNPSEPNTPDNSEHQVQMNAIQQVILEQKNEVELINSYSARTYDRVLLSLNDELNAFIHEQNALMSGANYDLAQAQTIKENFDKLAHAQSAYLETYKKLLSLADVKQESAVFVEIETTISNLEPVFKNTKELIKQTFSEIKAHNETIESSDVFSLILLGNINGQINEETYDDWSDQKIYLKKPGFLRLLNEVNKVKASKGYTNTAVLLNGINLTGETHLAGDNLSDLTQGKYAALALSFLKPQASTINDRDLLWSYDLVSNNNEISNFKEYTKAMFANPQEANFLSANLVDKNNQHLTDGSKIITFKNHKIGIVGSSSINLNRTNSYDAIQDLKSESYWEIAQAIDKEIAQLKANGAEYIIWMTSSENKRSKGKLSEIDKIAAKITEPIDLVYGLEHSRNADFIKTKNQENIPYVYTKYNDEMLVIDLDFTNLAPNEKPRVNIDPKAFTDVSTAGHYNKTKKMREDFVYEDDLLNPEKNADYHYSLTDFAITMKKFLRTELKAIENEVVFENADVIDLVKNQKDVAGLNSFLADLIQDNYVSHEFNFKGPHQFEFTPKSYDGVFLNSGTIYKNILQQKTLTKGDIYQMVYFSNHLVSLEISVANLLEKINLYQAENDAFSWSNKIRVVFDDQHQAINLLVRNENGEYVPKNPDDVLTILVPDILYTGFIFPTEKRDSLAFMKASVKYSKNDDDKAPIREIIIRLLKNAKPISRLYDHAIFNTLQTRAVSNNFNDKEFYLQKVKALLDTESANIQTCSTPDQKTQIQAVFNELQSIEPNTSLSDVELKNKLIDCLWTIKQIKQQQTSDNNTPKLRVGHWNILHQDGLKTPKNIAIAQMIRQMDYDVVALTEIMPIKADEEENNLPVDSIIKHLNSFDPNVQYAYVLSNNLEGSQNAALATKQHTSTERIAVIYKTNKVQPKAFANNQIGHIYSNPMHPGFFSENQSIDFSRPPYSVKFSTIGEIVNDFTLVVAHFDSPGAKQSQNEVVVTKELLEAKGYDTTKFIPDRWGTGSREADNARDMLDVIKEVQTIDNNLDDDFIFMGDTNIKFNQEWWAFKDFIDSGFNNLFADDELHKSTLSNKNMTYANPYDKIFVKTNLKTTNPYIYPIWNIFNDQILQQDWVNLAYQTYPYISWGSFENYELIRSMVSDHSPTVFELELNPNDEK
ncbi:hypothetical protein OF376_00285 [Ureaplasma miroungigenitalium]|uniref:Uncharacterized protein n=1 Tax=Ureaplasma miroungigenitalium TaxID=1042321 RepID=A0ABT3BLU0_9BACT|nr:hypothetical protein [Ureaplasma miroungigenitalium]MCV3728228.1 hypothetical protein [Ureaplasma miroungigenitalium]